MTTLKEIENRAGLARITCGWKKPELPRDVVRRYWRDVHSPAIARRVGVYDYRHYQFDPVRGDLLAPASGIDFHSVADEQLMWLSDVRYLDDAGLAAFDGSPPADVKPYLLGDIDLIVDKSTTYRAVGENGYTYLDDSGIATPQGPPSAPWFCLFFRKRGSEVPFRAQLKDMAQRWASRPGVKRLRLSLFDAPDMEAERKAGYPVKTHPEALQYQAWIDLVLDNASFAADLPMGEGAAAEIKTIHAYPVTAVYTSVYQGAPTLVGLRGYGAHHAIEALQADHQKQPTLLQWMYGPVAGGGQHHE